MGFQTALRRWQDLRRSQSPHVRHQICHPSIKSRSHHGQRRLPDRHRPLGLRQIQTQRF